MRVKPFYLDAEISPFAARKAKSLIAPAGCADGDGRVIALSEDRGCPVAEADDACARMPPEAERRPQRPLPAQRWPPVLAKASDRPMRDDPRGHAYREAGRPPIPATRAAGPIVARPTISARCRCGSGPAKEDQWWQGRAPIRSGSFHQRPATTAAKSRYRLCLPRCRSARDGRSVDVVTP